MRISARKHTHTLHIRSLLSISENVVHRLVLFALFLLLLIFLLPIVLDDTEIQYAYVFVQYGMLMIEHVRTLTGWFMVNLTFVKGISKDCQIARKSTKKETYLCQKCIEWAEPIHKIKVWNFHSNEPNLRHLDNTIQTIQFICDRICWWCFQFDSPLLIWN